jgi:hypothetical protein
MPADAAMAAEMAAGGRKPPGKMLWDMRRGDCSHHGCSQKCSMAEDAPVGMIAQRMADGRFDKAFLIREIQRFTGVTVAIPERPGKIVAVIPQHGY